MPQNNKVSRKIVFVLVFNLIAVICMAQNIGIYYAHNYLGNNLKVGCTLARAANSTHWTELGLKYSFNRKSYLDAKEFAFYNKGYAQKFGNHFGFFAKHAMPFYSNNYGLKLYGLIGLDYLFQALKYESYVHYETKDSSGINTYKFVKDVSVNYHTLELNLGIGSEIKIAKKMSLVLESGVSFIGIYHPKGSKQLSSGQTVHFNGIPEIDFLGYMSKVGVKYLMNE